MEDNCSSDQEDDDEFSTGSEEEDILVWSGLVWSGLVRALHFASVTLFLAFHLESVLFEFPLFSTLCGFFSSPVLYSFDR